MLLTEDRPRTEQVITGFICDRCKATYACEDVVEMQEMFVWQNVGGYGSVWGDGAAMEAVLCQKCTYELFKDFARIIE